MPFGRGIGSIVAVSLFVAACGDSSVTNPNELAAGVEIVSGHRQMGTVGQPLPEPIQVRVTGSGGQGVGGVEVEFLDPLFGGELSATLAGASLLAGAAGLGPLTVITDAEGIAAATWTLGGLAGGQWVFASVGGDSAKKVTFTATALTGPAGIVSTPGSFAGPVSRGLPGRPWIRVTDEFGNPVPGQRVRWTFVSGPGSLFESDSITFTNGHAFARVTLGTQPGLTQIEAAVSGFAPLIVKAVGVPAVTDPEKDNGPASELLVPPDVVRFGGVAVSGELVLYVEFFQQVVPNNGGGAFTVTGLIAIDADQDPSTGLPSPIDDAGGNSALGVDYFLTLFANADGLYPFSDASSNVTALVNPLFIGNSISIALPLSALGGDDGSLNMAAMFGTLLETTDVVPNDGHVVVGLGVAAPQIVSVAGAHD